MSYVLGVRRFGVTAIFADSMLSYGSPRDRKHEHISSKVAVLFPGCTYGAVGSWEEAQRFIERMQAAASSGNTPCERWQALERAVANYTFPTKSMEFHVLFSSRHEGVPIFYAINSSEGRLIRLPANMCSLGSGTELLREHAVNFCKHVVSEEKLLSMKETYSFPVTDFGYMIAFMLHQFVLGPTSYDLVQAGVGGFFHFIRQDSESEARQKPSLYIVAGTFPGTNLAVVVRYRFAFVNHPQFGELFVLAEKNVGSVAKWGIVASGWDSNAGMAQADVDLVLQAEQLKPPYHVLVAGAYDASKGPYTVYLNVFDGGYDADMTDYLSSNLGGIVEAHVAGQMEEWLAVGAAIRAGATELPPNAESITNDRKIWVGPT